MLLTATGVAVMLLALLMALLPGLPALGAAQPPWAGRSSAEARALLVRPAVSAPAATARPGCEASLERAAAGKEGRVPRLAIVGASFTAGVGPGRPHLAWSVRLARELHWDGVIYGVPGAGYIKRGLGFRGPVSAELRRVQLTGLKPRLVIVQAGHDDMGLPTALEEQRVRQAVGMIRAEAPQARIALLTVFPGRRNQDQAVRTDRAIVTAARAADPGVIIMDPLAGHWVFPRSRDGLHPTAAGDAWIAAKVLSLLRAHGIAPAPAGGGQVCDSAVTAPPSPQPSPPHPPHWR